MKLKEGVLIKKKENLLLVLRNLNRREKSKYILASLTEFAVAFYPDEMKLKKFKKISLQKAIKEFSLDFNDNQKPEHCYRNDIKK